MVVETRLWNLSRKVFVAIAASIALVAFGLSTPAHAIESPLSAAGTVKSGAAEVITLPSGTTIVVEATRDKGGGIAPLFSVGVGKGVYIYLSRSDQTVVAAGGAAGLAVLICGSTALIGCAAATAALTGAATWIANRGGICSTSTPRLEINMRVYTTTYKCVK